MGPIFFSLFLDTTTKPIVFPKRPIINTIGEKINVEK
jgi:hypothetical protein